MPNLLRFRQLLLLYSLLFLHTHCQTSCGEDRDCQLNGGPTGLCYNGGCVCHPSFLSSNGCQSVSLFNEPHGRIRYEFNYEQVTWSEADLSCKMKLGRLAKILNAEQNDYIKSEIQGRVTNYGLNDIDLFFGLVYNGGSPGEFRWSDSARYSTSYSHWYLGRLSPRGSRSKHVVISDRGYWEGVDINSDTKHGYVCEYDGIPSYVLHTTPKNYSEADATCRGQGYDVVSIGDKKELDYVLALYSTSGIRTGWVGLHRDYSNWRWPDGSLYDKSVLRVGNRDSYNHQNRVLLQTEQGPNFLVVTDEERVPFICKTAKVKRDCEVLKSTDPSLLSSPSYYVQPKEGALSKSMVYCDMSTDGGGYTYFIVKDKRNGVSSAETIPKFCRDFQPVDIVSPKQVLELRRILLKEGVLQEGRSRDTGLVPVAVFRDGKYTSLTSGSDITQLLATLQWDYNFPVHQTTIPPFNGQMLGISSKHLLTSFTKRSNDVLGPVCSMNNKQVPPESFSAVFTPERNDTLVYKIEETQQFDSGSVCAWITTKYQGKNVVYSMVKTDNTVVLKLVLDGQNDHFVIGGAPTHLTDFGIKDGSAHRLCLNLVYSQYEVLVDGAMVLAGNTFSRDTRGMVLEGVITLGDSFIGTVDSLDIWDSTVTAGARITKSPLYSPGKIIRWSDLYTSRPNDVLKPAALFRYSRFKVGIGPSGLRWAHNYCSARGGELGAPRDDYEFTLVLQLLQGHPGWINMYRQNNTLYSGTTTPLMNLTYIPSEGPDGNLTVNGDGDLETKSVTEMLPFLCQFSDVEEEIPELHYCLPEEVETEKGVFSWVAASTNSTVKVLCPHGVVEGVPIHKGYSSRTCVPGTAGLTPVWADADMSRCNYENRKTQELSSLRELAVTGDNAVEIAARVLDLTNNSHELDDTGVGMVTDIIEHLVEAQNSSATENITQTLSNILDVDEQTLSISQQKDRTSDRILDSLEKVAGSVADTHSQTLDTKNIRIVAARSSLLHNITLSSDNGVEFNLPAATVSSNKSAYIIAYTTPKLFTSRVLSIGAALELHTNTTQQSEEFLNTVIISAGLDREEVSNLTTPVQLVFPIINTDASIARCVYYSNNSDGQWLSDGLESIYDNDTKTVTCRSSHMTSFAVIMTIDAKTIVHSVGTNAVIMNTISYLCLFLSLVGLILTVMALTLQRTLWRLDMTKIHVYLSISLFVGYVIFLVGIDQTQSRALCITSAFLMHLAFLTAFVWMAVEAYTLYLQFVKVFPSYTPNFIPKCLIVVFSVPLAIAGGFLVAALSNDPADYYELQNYCWIKSYTLYYGFILPILLIVTCNMVLFGYVTQKIWRIISTKPENEENQLGKLSVQLRATVSVLVVLGVTWLIGAFTFGSASIVFQYIFIILNGLQGFSIFMFHVVLKPEVRKRWYNSIHDITNSLSSNSHALKSNSFHRAHKFQVNQNNRCTDDDSITNPGGRYNTSFCSSNSQKPLLLTDKRYTYLSNSNDYATIESRPSSVSSAISDHPAVLNGTVPPAVTGNGATPLIEHSPATPPDIPPIRISGASLNLKRPLSTVPSLGTPSTPGDMLDVDLSPENGYAFSPITHPRSWEYNPLNEESPEPRKQISDPLIEGDIPEQSIPELDDAFLREGEDQV
ncbi:uncharacterized protein LOC134815331 isoform X2 [Bolinopsis microptera]|uniref:uncharacterized protein LOC134815331 isoform X2 n=1 Tax=Bolinopsis microptera TaxID=2820187 RepID=UPI00307914D2